MATLKDWLIVFTEQAIVVIDGLALVIILFGTVQAVSGGLPLVRPEAIMARHVWLRYARWLVAGLTFQLAADIIETSITTDWESVARLAAIAVIRTFLNFFLERDLAEISSARTRAFERISRCASKSTASVVGPTSNLRTRQYYCFSFAADDLVVSRGAG